MAIKILGLDSFADRPIAGRVGIFGSVATFKTSSIVQTWPRKFGDRDKMVIFSFPGEKGWETIPRNEPDLVPIIWEVDDPDRISPHQVVKEVEATITKVLAGEYGKVTTFAGDGAHKLYPWYFRRALADKLANPPKSWDGDEDKLFGPSYGQAHLDYGHLMTKILSSNVPYAVMTFWESMEPDNPKDRSRDATRHAFPDLPGMMARNAAGEFSAMLFAEVTLPDMRGRSRGTWLTRPEGRVWGAHIKVPPEVGQRIPVRIPQDFCVLQQYMMGQHEEAAEYVKTHYPPMQLHSPIGNAAKK